MTRDDYLDAARILDLVAGEVEAGSIEANARDSRYLRGAAAGLRAAGEARRDEAPWSPKYLPGPTPR